MPRSFPWMKLQNKLNSLFNVNPLVVPERHWLQPQNAIDPPHKLGIALEQTPLPAQDLLFALI